MRGILERVSGWNRMPPLGGIAVGGEFRVHVDIHRAGKMAGEIIGSAIVLLEPVPHIERRMLSPASRRARSSSTEMSGNREVAIPTSSHAGTGAPPAASVSGGSQFNLARSCLRQASVDDSEGMRVADDLVPDDFDDGAARDQRDDHHQSRDVRLALRVESGRPAGNRGEEHGPSSASAATRKPTPTAGIAANRSRCVYLQAKTLSGQRRRMSIHFCVHRFEHTEAPLSRVEPATAAADCIPCEELLSAHPRRSPQAGPSANRDVEIQAGLFQINAYLHIPNCRHRTPGSSARARSRTWR